MKIVFKFSLFSYDEAFVCLQSPNGYMFPIHFGDADSILDEAYELKWAFGWPIVIQMDIWENEE